MSNSTRTPGVPSSYFETQRAALLSEIGLSLELVLQNINKLNRNLEGVIAVGNEFSAVEALWSQFETVMGKDADAAGKEGEGEHDDEEEGHAESEGAAER